MTETTNKPTHFVYHVGRSAGSEKGRWTRIGAAWPHKDGEGFTLQLDAMPLSGELVVRTPKVDEAAFAALVRQAFSQRRKTLRNTLKGLCSESLIKKAGLDPMVRPEQVSVASFVQLTALAEKND